ncbi:constitutive coactivator of PPAR-gamma-like protein 1 homolog [Salvelinus namaycush]|uniref:Constitutive coactivator of PPAR-gamma-like protein 1 homolog n=1 Tax=Salvelinus namaycush TaxID=8040 RepID=A0A8U0QHY7_SALNM|nr:constitutive coactivator of PPAR-gamma-like protein 1 homolog [Salvelinus namaycush]
MALWANDGVASQSLGALLPVDQVNKVSKCVEQSLEVRTCPHLPPPTPTHAFYPQGEPLPPAPHDAWRLRGVISTPVIRTFGRGAKFPLRGFKSQGTYQVGHGTYQVGHGTYQSKPTYSLASEVKERKKLQTEEKEKSPVMLSSDGSTTENGLEQREEGLEQREEGGLEEREEERREEGEVEESEVEQLKDQVMEVRESRAVNIQPESAFSSDSKMCNTNPRLNALNTDSACLRDAAEPLSAAASVLQTEE